MKKIFLAAMAYATSAMAMVNPTDIGQKIILKIGPSVGSFVTLVAIGNDQAGYPNGLCEIKTEAGETSMALCTDLVHQDGR